jgi:chemotaxis protein MotC
MAGHVALIQSELVAKSDVAKAMSHLDDARLLSPGTLIEEAALRRQVAAVAATGDFDRLQMLAVHYLYRFPNSLYAGNFRREFASLVAERAPVGDAERMRQLESRLAVLDAPDLRAIYLAIAKEGLTKGKLGVARFAAGNATRLLDDDAVERERARLYETAALAIASGSDEGLSTLERAAGADLGKEDIELLVAVRSVVGEIRRLPPPSPPVTEAQLGEMAASMKTVASVRQVIERTDRLLREAVK